MQAIFLWSLRIEGRDSIHFALYQAPDGQLTNVTMSICPNKQRVAKKTPLESTSSYRSSKKQPDCVEY